jgi:L-asparaginase II
VYAVGLADGRGIAVKIEDGSPRARAVVMAATLKMLGLDHEVLDKQSHAPLLGGGVPVGSVRPHPLIFS